MSKKEYSGILKRETMSYAYEDQWEGEELMVDNFVVYSGKVNKRYHNDFHNLIGTHITITIEDVYE